VTALRQPCAVAQRFLPAGEGRFCRHLSQNPLQIRPFDRAHDVYINGQPVNLRQVQQQAGAAAKGQRQPGFLQVPEQGERVQGFFENLGRASGHLSGLPDEPVPLKCGGRKHGNRSVN
jgi:hypothetical protein